jgi:asparagine synthase (glutamine-hydrolysing)
MCGIAGYWSKPGAAEASRRIVGEMCSVMRHRGPDDHGSWHEAETGIALGHRRLSILDLSPLGHQPMTSRNERFCISYNGEIYNFKALRCELEALGASFRGNSDTEVLVEAIARWGVRNTLPKLVGMFAFALWIVERSG